ncbi:MAG: site-2 protease family protein [Victivallaceae bacterium]
MFFIETLFKDPQYFLSVIFVVVFSVCCHEYSHARVALWQGDPTAANAGHLTLNPLKQMGVISLIMLAFVGLAWGQVPVNPARMRHRYSPALVAFAGPAMNILLFLAFCILLTLVALKGGNPAAEGLFFTGAMINMLLFIINMLPVPGLDGWAVLLNLYPNLAMKNPEFVKGASLLLIVLAIAFLQYLRMAGFFMTITVTNWLYMMFNATGWF